MVRIRRKLARAVAFAPGVFAAAFAVAQEAAVEGGAESGDMDRALEEVALTPDDRQSGSFDDSTGSLERSAQEVGILRAQGRSLQGDLRVGYVRADRDERDGSSSTSTNWRGRFRLGGTLRLSDWLLFESRLATTCTSKSCNPGFTLDDTIDTTTTIDQGDITFDELYLHAFREERFDVAVGRLQTKFVARAGVFAKSLDRNDSNNFNVNWTDGLHGTLHFGNESMLHLISEYNAKEGPSNVRRGPLDFSDSNARVSHFIAWESKKRLGPFTQRGFDITYLPSALLKDGSSGGPREDYVGLVARFASSRPFGTKGRRWNIAGEAGYAPETPTRSAVGLEGDGDVDGFAWNFAVSLMDLWPSHNIGFNYGSADAGWLLSPQYRDNEELYEIRYQWRRQNHLALEMRVRYREEIEQRAGGMRRRDELDFFARFTLGITR